MGLVHCGIFAAGLYPPKHDRLCLPLPGQPSVVSTSAKLPVGHRGSFTRAGSRNTTKQHYDDVIMGTMASQITSLMIVYSSVYSDADQRKHQSSASLAFVWGIHRGPVNSPHKWPVTRKMFPFNDVIMTGMLLQSQIYIKTTTSIKVKPVRDTNVIASFHLYFRFLDLPLSIAHMSVRTNLLLDTTETGRPFLFLRTALSYCKSHGSWSTMRSPLCML